MSGEKILVVEDEEDLRKLVCSKLRQLGYDVSEAGDGVTGLMAAEKILPHLIITDVVMPQKGGNDLIKDIQKTAWGKHIPIIVLTAHVKMKDYFEVIGLDFVEKPFDMPVLIQSIQKNLARSMSSGQQPGTIKLDSVSPVKENLAEIEVKDNVFDMQVSRQLTNEEGLATGEGSGRKVIEPRFRKLAPNLKRMLLVESDTRIVKELCAILSFYNCEVITLETASLCLERANGLNPDIIVIKEVPAKSEAQDLAHALKNQVGLRKVPIIIYKTLGEFITEENGKKFVLNTSGRELLQIVHQLSAKS